MVRIALFRNSSEELIKFSDLFQSVLQVVCFSKFVCHFTQMFVACMLVRHIWHWNVLATIPVRVLDAFLEFLVLYVVPSRLYLPSAVSHIRRHAHIALEKMNMASQSKYATHPLIIIAM